MSRGEGSASDEPPGGSSRSRPRRRRRVPTSEDSFGALEVRRIQPYEATKAYVCPGCNGGIATGTGHYVVVPSEAPELRRHWHKACWERRGRVRTPTR